MSSKFPEVPEENIFFTLRVYPKCGRSVPSEVESDIFFQSANTLLLELLRMYQNRKFFLRLAVGI